MKKRNKLIAVFAPLVLGATILVSQKVQAEEVDYQIVLNDGQKEQELGKLTIEDDDLNDEDFYYLTEEDYLLEHFQFTENKLKAENKALDHVERNRIAKKIVIKLKQRVVPQQMLTTATGINLNGQFNTAARIRSAYKRSGLGFDSRFGDFLREAENQTQVEQCFDVHLNLENYFSDDPLSVTRRVCSGPNTFGYSYSDFAIKYGNARELDLSKLSASQKRTIDDLRNGKAVDLANCPLDHAEFDNLKRLSGLGLAPCPFKIVYLFYQGDGRTYYRPTFTMEKLTGVVPLAKYFDNQAISNADKEDVAQKISATLTELHQQGIAYYGNIDGNILVDPKSRQISFVGLKNVSYQCNGGQLNPNYRAAVASDNRDFDRCCRCAGVKLR